MPSKAFICGVSGVTLTSLEAAFLQRERPCGFILFKRNIETPEQVRALISDVRAASGVDPMLILVDQEGGRVQRLNLPHWPRYPSARAFAEIYRSDPQTGLDCARLVARAMASDLRDLGINMDCAPVLDLAVAGASDVIGDRAYGEMVEQVAALGRAVCEGLLAGGVLPVIKHIPGHGRATADSHFALPVIDASLAELRETDFAPFARLSDMPAAMTAHVILTAVDAENAVTVSPRVISQIVRGEIGYGGLLITDDLSMCALSGCMEDRTRAAFDASCDLALHCNGKMHEMEAVAAATSVLSGERLARYNATVSRIGDPSAFDVAQARAVAEEMLAVTV
jgi:beta-N-acetylhexosaminidase